MENYRNSATKGMFKVMSKMGISTLHSYKGAQVFEAVGLVDEIFDRFFTGNNNSIQGNDFEDLYQEFLRFHRGGYPENQDGKDTDHQPLLQNQVDLHYHEGDEYHLNSPMGIVNLQTFAQNNYLQAYKGFATTNNDKNKKVTLRGKFKFKFDNDLALLLDEVEPASEIVKRLVT